jgi:hypothetical protein
VVGTVAQGLLLHLLQAGGAGEGSRCWREICCVLPSKCRCAGAVDC